MAITQISRIQHRRGLQQDLPQLASAELGWSIDQRRLYIGNGTLEEGAPTTGVTEILTEYSNLNELFSVLNAYTFYGNAAGYVAQTAASELNPITRSYQDKLDDTVSVRDFGAVGDGITNDTDAINRALQQIYKVGYNDTQPLARRRIYFPGGTYLITDAILIPPYARLIGDGISSTIIKQTQGNKFTANTVDSLFQTGTDLGTSGSVLPDNIEIENISFINSNVNCISSVLLIDSASNVSIKNSSFTGNSNSGSYPNLVSITCSTSSSSRITFENCKFLRAGNGIAINDSTVTNIRVLNSVFDQLANTAVLLSESQHFVSIGNYFGNVTSTFTGNGTSQSYYRFGDYSYNNPFYNAGLFLGNLQFSLPFYFLLTSSPLVIPLVPSASAIFEYTISNSSARRTGTIQLVNYNNTDTHFSDEYVETVTSVQANLFANNTSLIASVSSGTADLQFNYRRFY